MALIGAATREEWLAIMNELGNISEGVVSSAPNAAYAGLRVESGCPEEPALPSFSEDGVDLTLMRWMLSLSPAERLRVG